MAFYNGAGGAGDATTDSASEASVAVAAAAAASASANTAAVSATEAAASAVTAATNATTAATAATAATTKAAEASASAASAASYESIVTARATEAATSATEAETFSSTASGFSDLAEDWAVKTDGAVSGGEYSAKYHANAAATSASNASTSASDASTSASDAAQSAIDAAAVIPSQTGNSGKYLTTDGTDTSWATVTGGASALDDLTDVTITTPSTGQVLKYNGTIWVNDTDATGGGSGTVTSVAMSVPTGLSVAGSPITSSGTLAVTYSAGYAIPTTAKQTEWDTAYGWGNHASAGYLDSADIGVSVQAYDADLTSWAAIAPSSKQDTLVSATNIKTINGTSVLGSGDLTVSGSMTYPGAGIANSTGSAWGTSYTTSGSGTVVALATGATLTTASTSGTFTLGGSLDETVYAVVDAAGVALSPQNGTIQTWTLGASRTPTAGTWNAGESMTLMIDDGTARTVTWTSLPVVWAGGAAPILATTGFTVIELWKVGTTIYGAAVGNVA